jgi:hypothetical protein
MWRKGWSFTHKHSLSLSLPLSSALPQYQEKGPLKTSEGLSMGDQPLFRVKSRVAAFQVALAPAALARP